MLLLAMRLAHGPLFGWRRSYVGARFHRTIWRARLLRCIAPGGCTGVYALFPRIGQMGESGGRTGCDVRMMWALSVFRSRTN